MPLAHVGHWLVDLIYVLPLAVLGVALLVGRFRERRQRRARAADPARLTPGDAGKRPVR